VTDARVHFRVNVSAITRMLPRHLRELFKREVTERLLARRDEHVSFPSPLLGLFEGLFHDRRGTVIRLADCEIFLSFSGRRAAAGPRSRQFKKGRASIARPFLFAPDKP
jgi:hypothetical protein